jgi:hypothetical protein
MGTREGSEVYNPKRKRTRLAYSMAGNYGIKYIIMQDGNKFSTYGKLPSGGYIFIGGYRAHYTFEGAKRACESHKAKG